MSYIPQAGTFPARVIDYLRSLPAGSERSSAELAEELDQDISSIQACLKHATKNAALKTRKEGRRIFWSLGDGIPEVPHDYQPDPPLEQLREPPKPRKRADPPPEPVTAFRAALWSDGTLNIERNGLTVWLLPDEVAQLRGLLRGGA